MTLGENVAFWFIEDESGTMVDGHVLSDIRSEAKVIWSDMCDVNKGPIGAPWTTVPPKYHQEYWRRIESAFPILRLCENHYKADAIAHADYSHWYGARYPDSDSKTDKKKCSRTPSPALTRKARRHSLQLDSELRPQTDDENIDDPPPSFTGLSPPHSPQRDPDPSSSLSALGRSLASNPPTPHERSTSTEVFVRCFVLRLRLHS